MTDDDDTIPLEAVLKMSGVFPTGGQAKNAIQAGEVLVNGTVETRRKKRLRAGDIVAYEDVEITVEIDDTP